jgi:hypothetical protein
MRWAALGLGVAATLNALRDTGEFTRKPRGSRWDSLFMLALDLQVLFGMILYFGLSPSTKVAFANLSGAVQNPALRFWLVDHAGWMFGACVLVRIGRVLALTATTTRSRRQHRVLWFSLTTAAMLIGTPWPGLDNGRPLLR